MRQKLRGRAPQPRPLQRHLSPSETHCAGSTAKAFAVDRPPPCQHVPNIRAMGTSKGLIQTSEQRRCTLDALVAWEVFLHELQHMNLLIFRHSVQGELNSARLCHDLIVLIRRRSYTIKRFHHATKQDFSWSGRSATD